jgi:hypothetical protein
MTPMTRDLGDVMAAQLRQDFLTESRPRNIERAKNLISTSAEWQQQKWHQQQERQWEGRLNDLQQCIGELLIKNQRLRESEGSTAKVVRGASA